MAAERPGRLWRFLAASAVWGRSVRVRTAAVATLVVGAALVVGSVALVTGLRISIENYLRTAAELRAEDVADVLATSDGPRDLAVDDEEDVFVQVFDDEGNVVTSSPNLRGEPPVASLSDGQSKRMEGFEFEDDTFMVVAVEADDGGRGFTVLVGRNAEVIGESTSTVFRYLAVGVPVMLVIAAATTWWLAGRALSPVEAIRSEVEGITAAALSRRVPVPPTTDEVARLAATMNVMLARLEEAQAQQRRFVSDASHELRSPVTTIRQHAEVALAHPESTEAADLADVVLAEDLRLQRLVDDLLWLARGDENTLVAHDEAVDLDDVALEEVARLRVTTSLEVDGRGISAGRVLGEPRLLRQLLRNLTDNAVRHARTTVRLSLGEAERGPSDDGRGSSDDETEVLLVVEDDGAGIPVGERTRVFERFVRLDEARDRDTGGSGLGLSIADEIATAHRGTIQASAAATLGGARFEVRLPAARD